MAGGTLRHATARPTHNCGSARCSAPSVGAAREGRVVNSSALSPIADLTAILTGKEPDRCLVGAKNYEDNRRAARIHLPPIVRRGNCESNLIRCTLMPPRDYRLWSSAAARILLPAVTNGSATTAGLAP
jgi:hypothetical protein